MYMATEMNHGIAPRGDCDDHDLIEDLGRRMGSLWECDRYIASAEGRPELQEYWRGTKSREQSNIDQLKKLIE
jgi:hypothetical protein